MASNETKRKSQNTGRRRYEKRVYLPYDKSTPDGAKTSFKIALSNKIQRVYSDSSHTLSDIKKQFIDGSTTQDETRQILEQSGFGDLRIKELLQKWVELKAV